MDGTILVAYGTRHGSTREVAEAVADGLRSCGLEVETLDATRAVDVSGYAGVVVGGALYMGRWHPSALSLLERNRRVLAALPVAVFGMGPRTLAEQEVESSRAQLERALAKVPEVKPFSVAIFGGVIGPHALRFPFNRIPASDARDWDAIAGWAAELATRLDYGKAAADTRDRRIELQQTPR
jgi:menaquinone-dependent protoporphyrinogen oxidase